MKLFKHPISALDRGKITENEWTPESAIDDSIAYIERITTENETLKREVKFLNEEIVRLNKRKKSL